MVVVITGAVVGAVVVQPGVVPYAVPPMQLTQPGSECAGLQRSVVTEEGPTETVICLGKRMVDRSGPSQVACG